MELAKVKATLEASIHAPHAGGDDERATVADKWNQRNDEVTTTSETEAEQSRMKHARTLVSETSQREYDTSLENPKRTYIGKDGRVYQRRRRSRTESRLHSRQALPMTTNDDTKQLLRMFKECMKTTLTSVLEGKRDDTSNLQKKPTVSSGVASVDWSEQATASPVKVAATNNPMVMSYPHMAITKFTGENWNEFIEYFDSLAEANMWSDKDKLSFLLMSIDSKPRMYARGDNGTPQTYNDVRRRLQQRYGQNEPAFTVRSQLREIQRLPGERLEMFADRLQEVAQQGQLDPLDRDELFYFAFLNAVKDTRKMQNFIKDAHSKN